jgi:serine-type D-Ala-D-Ala carboxypeptidase/endopeptidase (penicillin-binding protein 4)
VGQKQFCSTFESVHQQWCTFRFEKDGIDVMKNTIRTWAGVQCVAALCTALFLSTPADALTHRASHQHVAAKAHAKAKTSHARASRSLEGIVIVEESTGKVVTSTNSTTLFNPASNVKVSTSLFALRTWGPDYRFTTEVRTNGTINADGELNGDIFVSGHYMLFGEKQARELAKLLSAKGIKSVKGNLYINSDFSMDLRTTGEAAGNKLLSILDPHHKTPKLRNESGLSFDGTPELAIAGSLKIGSPPATPTTLLAQHNSPPLKDILKVMLCYSDNNMAGRFGEMLGGVTALRNFLIKDVGVSADEVQLASTSGLFVNRLSPRAMMMILQTFQAELKKHQLVLSDVLAVSGIDEGTMKKRLNWSGEAGSVTAKTGTLPETDNGVSSLSGELGTKNDGSFLFVIFHMHGGVAGFRTRQNTIVSGFQSTHSGAKPISYTPILPRVDGEDFWN